MKDAVWLQRSDLENFMNTGLIQKPIFLHDFNYFRMCEVNFFINLF